MDTYNHVTPIFLVIYLLVGNVMLLNLLIAVFTLVWRHKLFSFNLLVIFFIS